MSCAPDKHDKRAINPFVHPTEGIELIGGPPQTDEEPAWCMTCGALWSKKPWGLGWGWLHPLSDRDAPTIFNMLRDRSDAKAQAYPVASVWKVEGHRFVMQETGEWRCLGCKAERRGEPSLYEKACPTPGPPDSPPTGKT